MNWSSLAEFADMGGYALYVWGSYGLTAAALAWEALMLAHRRRGAVELLREEALQAAAEGPAT